MEQSSVRSSSSLPSSPPPSLCFFTRFTRLPPELQDLIWGFALPRRTVYLRGNDLERDKPCLPRHHVPAVAQVSRSARAVATRTGRWLWFGPGGPKSQQRYKKAASSQSAGDIEYFRSQMRQRILWFDAARDTLLIVSVRLWPQDVEANPVAVEMRLPTPRAMLPCDDKESDEAANNDKINNNNNNTAVTGFIFSLDTELYLRQPYVTNENKQLLFYFPRLLPPEELLQATFDSPVQDITGGDPRLWPWHCVNDGDDASSFSPWGITAAEPPAYTDSDLEVAIERPLAVSAHDEFFPEGSTACFVDLSALEPLSSSSPPPHLSSYSYSYSSPAKSPANPYNASVLTRQTLARLLDAYAHTQDLDRTTNTKTVAFLQRLLLLEEETETETDATLLSAEAEAEVESNETFFDRKRRAIAFKWLRINWMQLSRGEREGLFMKGAARCFGCCPADIIINNNNTTSFPPSSSSSSSSALPWTSLRWPSSPGQEETPRPTSAEPSLVYRMPRPWSSAFACPRDFNLEHAWTRRVLEAMPRVRLGLLLRLQGEAAAVRAAGEPNAHWLGRRRGVGGADVMKGGSSL